MFSKRALLIAIFLLTAALSSAAQPLPVAGVQKRSIQAPRLWGNLEQGRYEVGFRLVTFYDSRRMEPGHSRGRPIEIALWYPASRSTKQGLTLGEYLNLSDISREIAIGEENEVAASRRKLAVAMTSDPKGVADEILDELLASRLLAVGDARPAPGAFPLVLWSARHGTVLAQSVLSEYLASHGYVVAYARYKGDPVPAPYETKTEAEKRAAFGFHAGDLQFALANLRQMRNVAPSRKAVMSWSYAGESATNLQLDHRDIGLVISLSSNVLSNWIYQANDALSALDAARLQVPYVLMSERVGTNGAIRTPPPLLDRMPESYFVVFNELAHGNFNAIEGMIPSLFDISNVPRWSKSGPVAQMGYQTIARFVLHFLDSYLKAKHAAHDKAWNAGLPQNFVTVTRLGQKRDKQH